MTALDYIYRTFVPPPDARLSEQAALRELNLIRRSLHFKVRTNAKLSPVEQHLIRSFPELRNKFFAPSIVSVGAHIIHAFLKPIFIFGAVSVTCAVISPGIFTRGTNGTFAQAQPVSDEAAPAEQEPVIAQNAEKNIDMPQLALALAGNEPPPAPVDTAARFQLPELPAADVPIVVPQAAEQAMIDRTAEAHLGQQRNLVRFISGIIAAFRPTIKDCGLIARYIVEESAQENVDPIYVAAVIAIESRFSSTAESDAGALGLMQLMPLTARAVANSKGHHRTGQLVDPKTNIKLGISYLKQLEDKYKGNRFLALAAYNWGPSNIDKSGGKYRRIPGSVRKYSTTVLERTLAWRRHFDKATLSADELQTVSREDAAKNS